MKAIYFIFSILLLTVIISMISFFKKNTVHHTTSFAISDTKTAIKLQITYNANQADKVEKYIDSCFQPEVIFGNSHKVNKEVRIKNEAVFHINASQGSFCLTADKKSNSKASLDEVINMCNGLRAVIKPD